MNLTLRVDLNYKRVYQITSESLQTHVCNIGTTKKEIRQALKRYTKSWTGKGKLTINWVAIEGYTDQLEFTDISDFEEKFVGKVYRFGY